MQLRESVENAQNPLAKCSIAFPTGPFELGISLRIVLFPAVPVLLLDPLEREPLDFSAMNLAEGSKCFHSQPQRFRCCLGRVQSPPQRARVKGDERVFGD